MITEIRAGAGSRLGRYEMLAPIASGGMASVWAARLRGASGFTKIVAIKSMLPDLADEPEYRTMFLDEARIASKLRHPNVCETFDLGEENGELFMAMEWIDGVSCHRLLRNADKNIRPIAPDVAARIVAGACAGLHAAHEAVDDDGSPLAIVHRDVSPHNLLISVDGHVKVTDFGVAKARGKKHATSAGQAKGKLAYMAPEQLRDVQHVDRRADVFSLGCVLYEITTGEKPFDAETDVLLMRAILDKTPKRPSAIVETYPAELERIILRAMAKDPNDRFASAEGLRLALERWLGGRASEREIAMLVHDRCQTEIDARRAAIQEHTTRPPMPLDAAPSGSKDRGRQLTIGLGLFVIAIALASLFVRRPLEPSELDATRVMSSKRETPVVITPVHAIEAPRPKLVEPPRVTLHLDTLGATVIVDGDTLDDVDPSSGDFAIDRPAKGEMRVVLVKAPGHVDRLFVIDAATPATVEVSLVAAVPQHEAQNEAAAPVL